MGKLSERELPTAVDSAYCNALNYCLRIGQFVKN